MIMTNTNSATTCKRIPDIAKQYEALKLSLLKRYEHDRDGYTAAKGDFIREITARAKAETNAACLRRAF